MKNLAPPPGNAATAHTAAHSSHRNTRNKAAPAQSPPEKHPAEIYICPPHASPIIPPRPIHSLSKESFRASQRSANPVRHPASRFRRSLRQSHPDRPSNPQTNNPVSHRTSPAAALLLSRQSIAPASQQASLR